MASVSIVGSTGLVGSYILSQLLASQTTAAISTITRRDHAADIASSPKLRCEVSTDTASWPDKLSSLIKATSSSVLFSGLGTTRGDAGSFEKQYEIDYTLNLNLAKAAADVGIKNYVLISTGSANSSSWFHYLHMKGKLEDEVSKLGFEKVAILRPGLILGEREKPRPFEKLLRSLAHVTGSVGGAALKDMMAQDASAIAKAAIRAGMEENLWQGRTTKEGEKGAKIWIVSQSEIVELAKGAKF
ncbi:hypothetical protein EDC01DRAFT_697513 [Geopyxis carbonaria]|nr:hypothetical protein EDC01DRAFT_697513 [Geopyxis carbonaria]